MGVVLSVRPFFDFYPVRSGCPLGVGRMGIPFVRLTRKQCILSVKGPSRPTICQQIRKTSIQVTGIYKRGEKPQTKIKKSSSRYFQQGNLCYCPDARIILLIIFNIQRL
ncbi:MAG TPA: hypothetical protein DDY57_09375 [Franconibacter pulveris]|nr:hypothetical protein [Franconibacter pulveris]